MSSRRPRIPKAPPVPIESVPKATRAAAGPTLNASPAARLLLALRHAEALSTIGPRVSLAWAAGQAAKRFDVPLADLACLLLDKLGACSRAREAHAAIAAADAELDRPPGRPRSDRR